MNVRTPHRRRLGLLCAASLLLTTGCGGDGEPADDPASPGSAGPTARPSPPSASPELGGAQEVIAAGLAVPWDIAFLPDGAALVTERDSGRILRVGPDRAPAGDEGLAVSEVRTIADVDPTGEGGLLGIAVSPEYDTDRTVFIYYSTGADNRIARLRPGEPPEPVLTGIPHAANHNGGRLTFGPDGYLYAGTGDAGARERSQDRDSLAGKILRMTPDGEPAPGNPFDNHVWAYGLRNPQGLAWDPADRLWVTEFGENRWDELNRIEAGGNYGWPEVEGTGGADRFVDPVVVWPPAEASCSGLAALDRTLVAGCLRGQRLWMMELTGSGTVLGAPEPQLMEEYGRLRAVVVAPDGSLWLSTSNRDGRLPTGPDPADDRIIRLLSGSGGAGRT